MVYEPIFSIILPTYNHGYIIWRAILSVLNQSYPFFELIVTDDCSQDETGKLVKTFTDPRIRYYRLKKHSGASSARNFGIKKAKGEYIAYIDADNQWYPDFLETFFHAFKKYPNKVLIFSKKNYRLKVVDDTKVKDLRDEFYGHRKYFDLKRLWQRKIIIDTNTLVHKKEIIKRVGGWDTKINFWEDFEFTLRISKKYSKGFLYLNRALVDYEQILRFKDKKKTIANWEKAEQYIFNKHKNHPLIKEQRWYPPEKFKSTESVVKYLKSKVK